MNFSQRVHRLAVLPQRIRGMFNLNDPRWGRGDNNNEDGSKPDSSARRGASSDAARTRAPVLPLPARPAA
jgi:hypothetical protein